MTSVRMRRRAGCLLLTITALAACAANTDESSTATSVPATVTPVPATSGTSSPNEPAPGTPAAGTNVWKATTDPKAIPLGDGHRGTAAKVGDVFVCQASFPDVGGAFKDGPWIDTTAGTWDATTKVAVQGSVTWPAASFAMQVQGAQRLITTNGLPSGLPTGTFPIASSDPAYQYDRNPNTIEERQLTWTVPVTPTAAGAPSCLSGGPIGVATDGVPIFDALDGPGRDAGAHEVQDGCSGHPERTGMYHYHTGSSCLAAKATGASTLIGYAADGFGIFVERDAAGALPTNADLDACHGRTSTVVWDGRPIELYHYSVTLEYPYLLGCYHGTPTTVGGFGQPGMRGGPGGRGGLQTARPAGMTVADPTATAIATYCHVGRAIATA